MLFIYVFFCGDGSLNYLDSFGNGILNTTMTTTITKFLIPNKLESVRNETQFENIKITYLKYKKNHL
jgi:hypothetical protein